MQIYTKILLGMAVGAVIGLTLGPRSALLEADLYRIKGPQAVLHLDPQKPETRLVLPAGDVRLRQHEVISEPLTDALKASHSQPVRVRVTFAVSERMLLGDSKLATQLGQPTVGDEISAWLTIRNTPLAGGGFISSPEPISAVGDTITTWLKPVGEAFMRLLKLVIVPLVFASLLVGVANLGDLRTLGRVGGRTLAIFLLTTAGAVSLGLVLANLINPGSFIDEAERARLLAEFGGDVGSRATAAANAPSAIDNLLAVIPTNPIQSLATGDMLQIIFFALVLGIALTRLGAEKARPVVTFFDRLQDAMVVIIQAVMAVAPFGVAALVADVLGNSGLSVLKALVVYGGVVVLGLALHTLLIYGGLVRFVARVPLGRFFRAIRPAQLVAFSTSSSSATLPVTLECAEKNLKISNGVSSFVLPLGSTVNMDGTALYQGVAAVFIAQVFQLELSFTAQLTIVLTATLASIGAAGVPGAGMITLALVLTTAGIPELGLALILGIDRLLDMFRTTVNVTGDLAVAAAVARGEGETFTSPSGPPA
jgi:proton glutamate symport protein